MVVKEVLEKAIRDGKQKQSQDIPEGFVLNNDGLFCVNKKAEERISNYIKVIAFTKSKDGILKVLEFRDYKGNLQKMVAKPKMFTKDGDQLRILLISKGFIFAGNSLSK